MDFELSAEQHHWQEVAHAFAQEEVAPLAREADATGTFPLHLIRRLGALGFLAATVAPEYGGAGMDYVSYALLLEELGRGDSSGRRFLTGHAGLVAGGVAPGGGGGGPRRHPP